MFLNSFQFGLTALKHSLSTFCPIEPSIEISKNRKKETVLPKWKYSFFYGNKCFE